MTDQRWAEYMPIDDLAAADRNAKDHDQGALDASARAFGFIEPCVIDERTGQLLAGHGRTEYLAAERDAGNPPPEGVKVDDDGAWSWLVVRGVRSKDDAHAEALGLALNRVGERGGWKMDVLELAVTELLQTDYADAIGWTADELDELIASSVATIDSGPRREPTPVDKRRTSSITELGDLWLLGPHRLLCGDSLDDPTREALLDGHRPDAIFTDPPYGMNLDTDYGKIHEGHGGGVYDPVAGDAEDFDPAVLLAAFTDVPEQWWWGADYYREHLPPAGSWVVWDKRGVDGEGIYDDVIGNHFGFCWSKHLHRREIARVTWSGHNGLQQEDTATRIHPTQKPVALVEWFAERWMKKGWRVLDLFAGGGSTLIACERRGMVADLMELSPIYVDVICERWQAFTGLLPVRASTGEPVDFLAPELVEAGP